MGTNYYLTKTCPHPCVHCAQESLHIGKRSAGWTFGFQAYPEEGLTSWEAWKERIREAGIVVDEYGEEISPADFEKLVLATLEPWGPSRVIPLRRDGISPILGTHDDRFFVDREDWDFWEGDFS